MCNRAKQLSVAEIENMGAAELKGWATKYCAALVRGLPESELAGLKKPQLLERMVANTQAAKVAPELAAKITPPRPASSRWFIAPLTAAAAASYWYWSRPPSDDEAQVAPPVLPASAAPVSPAVAATPDVPAAPAPETVKRADSYEQAMTVLRDMALANSASATSSRSSDTEDGGVDAEYEEACRVLAATPFTAPASVVSSHVSPSSYSEALQLLRRVDSGTLIPPPPSSVATAQRELPPPTSAPTGVVVLGDLLSSSVVTLQQLSEEAATQTTAAAAMATSLKPLHSPPISEVATSSILVVQLRWGRYGIHTHLPSVRYAIYARCVSYREGCVCYVTVPQLTAFGCRGKWSWQSYNLLWLTGSVSRHCLSRVWRCALTQCMHGGRKGARCVLLLTPCVVARSWHADVLARSFGRAPQARRGDRLGRMEGQGSRGGGRRASSATRSLNTTSPRVPSTKARRLGSTNQPKFCIDVRTVPGYCTVSVVPWWTLLCCNVIAH